MTDEPLTICPECGSSIRRVLYAAGVVFKGSGFYKTDHVNSTPSDKGENNHKAESNGTNGTATDNSKKSETTSTDTTASTSSSAPSRESKAAAPAESKVA
jgi:predicted nucleic acid-binding Zn ribbon protein